MKSLERQKRTFWWSVVSRNVIASDNEFACNYDVYDKFYKDNNIQAHISCLQKERSIVSSR